MLNNNLPPGGSVQPLMPCLIQVTPTNGKSTYINSDEIYALEKSSTGSTLILTVIEVLEPYEDLRQQIDLASALVASASKTL